MVSTRCKKSLNQPSWKKSSHAHFICDIGINVNFGNIHSFFTADHRLDYGCIGIASSDLERIFCRLLLEEPPGKSGDSSLAWLLSYG